MSDDSGDPDRRPHLVTRQQDLAASALFPHDE